MNISDIGKAALSIAVALIIGSIAWSASHIVSLDKDQALTNQRVQQTQTSINLLVTELHETRDRWDETVEKVQQGQRTNTDAIRDLDALVKQIGSNLETRIQTEVSKLKDEKKNP